MRYRICVKSWKWGVVSLVFMAGFLSLGNWQLNRAKQKEALHQVFVNRQQAAPLFASQLLQQTDPRFYRVQLKGQFDSAHTLLLDNKTFHGQVGYEVYTPFKAEGFHQLILIDRGFVPLGTTRAQLPTIRAMHNTVSLQGFISVPPAYVAFSPILEDNIIKWPLRIAYVDTKTLQTLLHAPLFPFIVTLSPNEPAAYPLEWRIVTMPPERHRGYAVQWFAFALTLLILSFALNVRIMR